jgi:hypothetical protein
LPRPRPRGVRTILLSGRLDQTDLFEICQFILMGQKTGVLEVEARGKRGALYFDHGQIVNALDDALGDGEQAAYRIFAWSGGTFVFRLQPPPPLRSIQTAPSRSSSTSRASWTSAARRARSAAKCRRREGRAVDTRGDDQEAPGDRRRASAAVPVAARRARRRPGGDDPLARLWEQAHAAQLSASSYARRARAWIEGRADEPAAGLVASDTVTMAIAALGASVGAQRREARRARTSFRCCRKPAARRCSSRACRLRWTGPRRPAEDWLEEAAGSTRGLIWLGAPRRRDAA